MGGHGKGPQDVNPNSMASFFIICFATGLVLSLLSLFACNDHKKEPVDQTRTTSAIIVQPTLHDGHAAEPNNAEMSPMVVDFPEPDDPTSAVTVPGWA